MSLPKFSVDNPVLVNMIMVAILVSGVWAGLTLTREMFPESRPNEVLITTVYPGATPEEVENGIAQRIEEAIKDVEDIDKIETTITEGISSIFVTLTNEVDDLDQKVNEFKAAIDTIPRDELPRDAEETMVSKFEPRLPVISIALFGDVDEGLLKDAGRRLRDDLLLLPEVSDVELTGTRKDELVVEVEPEKLNAYQLSLDEVAAEIRRSNLDLPAGEVKTAEQNIAVRTLGETDEAQRIADTIVKTRPGGQVVRVRDIGRVIDAFEESDTRGRFNGRRAVDVIVYKTGDQDAIRIANLVKAYVAGKRGDSPPGAWATFFDPELRAVYERSRNDPYPTALTLATHSDLSRYIADRLDLLKRNGAWGLLFVFLTLLFTLNWRVAFWVMMGLVLSICGGIFLMSVLGVTLNLITAFGLIVVLGLIVDDAIVVGENVYARVERGDTPRVAAIRGTEEVTWPVLIAVTTTIGAFFPLMFIEGRIGDFMGVLPIVVMAALVVSLVEALMILPAHLSDTLKAVRQDLNGKRPHNWLGRLIAGVRAKQQYLLGKVLSDRYAGLLRRATRYRYVTLAAAIGALFLSLGLVAGGRVEVVLIQKLDSETILVNVEMPIGTPVEKTDAVLRRIEAVANDTGRSPEVKSVYTLVGSQVRAGTSGATVTSRSHLGQVIVELASIERRDRKSSTIIAEMRAAVGVVPGANSIKFTEQQGGPGGAEIELEITGRRTADILAAVDTLKRELATKDGVFDIDDDYEQGRRELQIELLDSARPLGLTTQTLATEIRGAFYGLEARTLQRDREDVDIRVRFPESRRQHLHELESMRIATPTGAMVPIGEVARIVDTTGSASIRRIDQRRAVVVSADVDQDRNNPNEILSSLEPVIRGLEAEAAGLQIRFAGNKRELSKSLGSLQRDFVIALLLIFVMLAGLFKSYLHPLVVLAAVPFGITGAVAGHYVMDYPLTILSMIGLVALTGIVVNDALILVDFIKKELAAGRPLNEAVVAAGRRRLRPIMLTSLTTILGLAPLMTETSFQARFLIPMAISISFGLGFATLLTLLVVPSFYLIAEDFKALVRWLWTGQATAVDPGEDRAAPGDAG